MATKQAINKVAPRRYGPRGDPMGRFRRFVAPANDSGCQLWTGTRSGAASGDYGSFWFEGRMQKAHRASWKLHNGEIPEGLEVCHRCDVPLCVNLDHLFLGTHQDNIADMMAKGRVQRVPRPGETNTQAKITANQVREMRRAFSAHEKSYAELADIYGLHPDHIYQVVSRRAWASVE